MAGGFWKGLLHGGVVSVIGLGTLSLMTPLPQKGEAPKPDSGDSAEISESTPAPQIPNGESSAATPVEEGGEQVEPQQQANTPAGDEGHHGPQAATVDLPIGSEFGRGSDVAPQPPAALSSRPREARPSPLAATAPADNSVPARELPSDLRPDSGLPPQAELPESVAAPEFGLPEAQPAPSGSAAPGLAGLKAPDGLPETALPQMAEPQIEEQGGPADRNQPADDTAEREAEPETATPGLPTPSLDLSTPPDLSELRALERD